MVVLLAPPNACSRVHGGGGRGGSVGGRIVADGMVSKGISGGRREEEGGRNVGDMDTIAEIAKERRERW